jgi:hypothetical protein
MTVAEYINLFIWFHWKTGGKLLDLSNWTLLAGSLYRDGVVPVGRSGDGRLRVCWCSHGNSLGDLRARQAVLG